MNLKKTIDIFGEITGITYKPLLCDSLDKYNYSELDAALSKGSFLLQIDTTNQIAVSWWVTPKRTRSYPYSRVYNTLSFSGKRVTIIPIIKDEGQRGDRDFLQWDTISLMSLLDVYAIISYYDDAAINPRYPNKITSQKFNLEHIKGEIDKLMYYQSSPLHWNMEQLSSIGDIGSKTLNAYSAIAEKLNVEMHSWKTAERKISIISESQESFMTEYRELAQQAQHRESVTIQPKEHITGIKGRITIKNFLGGYYYLTCDEVEIHEDEIHLIEAKHTKNAILPSNDDIKDGLLKMRLFTNLENLKTDTTVYKPVPILKLTTDIGFDRYSLSAKRQNFLEELAQEAAINGFRVTINGSQI